MCCRICKVPWNHRKIILQMFTSKYSIHSFELLISVANINTIFGNILNVKRNSDKLQVQFGLWIPRYHCLTIEVVTTNKLHDTDSYMST